MYIVRLLTATVMFFVVALGASANTTKQPPSFYIFDSHSYIGFEPIIDANGKINSTIPVNLKPPFKEKCDSAWWRPEGAQPSHEANIKWRFDAAGGKIGLDWDCVLDGSTGLNEGIDFKKIGVDYKGVCAAPYSQHMRYLSSNAGTAYCLGGTPNVNPNKNSGKIKCDLTGGTDPINVGTGNNFQEESDYESPGIFPLVFKRYYNSDVLASDLRYFHLANWRNSFNRKFTVYGEANNIVAFRRADNKMSFFSLVDGKWTPDPDVVDTLTPITGPDGARTGWTFVETSTGQSETFDDMDRLLQISDRAGRTQKLTYSNGLGGYLNQVGDSTQYLAPSCKAPISGIAANREGLLMCVTHSNGQTLQFQYDEAGRMIGMTDPAGGTTEYRYGGVSSYTSNGAPTDNLTSVIRADGSTRTYWYNEPGKTADANFEYALTGITDENGDRFTTWTYDAQGRALSSEHGDGVERFAVTYRSFNFGVATNSVAGPNGVSRNISIFVAQDVVKNRGESQPAGSGCPASALSKEFDGNGNQTAKTDFNGVRTEFTYDMARNLEIMRKEAVGRPEERRISTKWHAIYALPVQIAEPNRITSILYDAKGNMLEKSVRSTLDSNGASGFSAVASDQARKWSADYDSLGQQIAHRSPNSASTQYAYDSAGKLSGVTNSLGHVTSYSDYSPKGELGKITDPNGLITRFYYSQRGWLISTSIGTLQTFYEHDAVGQVTSVKLPSGLILNFKYDIAHRLEKISDREGNTINYSYDMSGNRVGEVVADASGTLIVKVARVFDELNRLKETTGGVQ